MTLDKIDILGGGGENKGKEGKNLLPTPKTLFKREKGGSAGGSPRKA